MIDRLHIRGILRSIIGPQLCAFLIVFLVWSGVSGQLVAQTFPLKIDASNRYLVDQSGKPFFLNGDAGWSLVTQLNYEQCNQYLTDRAKRGFNGVLINLLEHHFADRAPANISGVPPFTGAPFTSPNEAYFAFVDSALDQANRLGMVLFLCPIYLGFDCGDQGWCAEVQTASAADLKSWGEYLGHRYGKYANIIWVIGGDTDPTAVRSKVDSMVSGLKEADSQFPNRLITTHSERGTQAVSHWPESWVTLNNIYTSHANLISIADAAYNRSPRIPFFLIEAGYENESGITGPQVRAQAYWTILRGGCGYIFGNCPIWEFGSPTMACKAGDNWKGALGSVGSVAMTHFKELFTSRHWWSLVPDVNGKVLTDGAMSGIALATVAYTLDSTTIIGYLPTERTVTINPSVLKGEMIQILWYNPVVGDYFGDRTSAKTTQSYRPPSSADWVLVIDIVEPDEEHSSSSQR